MGFVTASDTRPPSTGRRATCATPVQREILYDLERIKRLLADRLRMWADP